MLGNLPQELFEEILLRLPAIYLLRFRCVSKLWNSIITNPNFITTHLDRPNQKNLFLVRRCTLRPKKENYSLHFDNETFDRYLESNFPFKSWGNYYLVVGCCNGLVCLVHDYVYFTRKVILWNPSIRKSVTLPATRPLGKIRSPYDVAVGFGFDSSTNDYKVVRILNLPAYNTKVDASIKVQLYSLASNSWKTITAVVPYCRTFGDRAFTNENFHWLSHYVRDDRVCEVFILSFDMRDEVFREIMIPESSVQSCWSLSMLEKSLCLLQQKYSVGYMRDHVLVWVMREYGVAESWTKQFSIDQDIRISSVLGFRNNGDFLYKHSSTEELVLQTLESKENKYLGIRGVSILKPFVESLVLINQANDADSGTVVHKKRKSRCN